ncbi:hypothetical protein AUN08_18810 [Cronobacter sakazakii]|nr:hypothetical protein [Cronobacter sakazakii]
MEKPPLNGAVNKSVIPPGRAVVQSDWRVRFAYPPWELTRPTVAVVQFDRRVRFAYPSWE